MDAIQKANSGHPGLPLGAAPMAYVLWRYHLKHNPSDPKWPDRDRFILSPGHGSMLLYSLLHLNGYGLSMDDIREFRQWDSLTPGHPESLLTPGVEATTGPLGQGSVNAVGMAVAERFLANYFNRPGFDIVDHFSYALVSDGDLMEGLAAEAASLAGHLKLGKLIYLYDSNDITLDGPMDLSISEDLAARYRSYGWQVLHVADGDTDLAAIDGAIHEAKADTTRPSIIIVKTTIGFGSPNKQGTAASHGSPLGEDEIALTRRALDWEWDEPFFVPDAVRDYLSNVRAEGGACQGAWNTRFEDYAREFPALASQWEQAFSGSLPEGWDVDLPQWAPGEKAATRAAAGVVENAIAAKVPWLMGGDADLSCSTKCTIKDGGSFNGATGEGRNIHYGIREHAMGSIANGIAYHGGIRTYASTFFVFADYMRASVRLAAMNDLPVVYIWTHDSIAVGEDGPTHQPVEHLMSLRVIPGLHVVRPADPNETAAAWAHAMARGDGPTALVLSRQSLPALDYAQLGARGDLSQGAYVLADADDPAAIIIATGAEVHLALSASETLAAEGVGVRVVAMPCMELFDAQPDEYKESVLPKAVTARVTVEAGATLGWQKYAGLDGITLGVDEFGASAPGDVLAEKYGMTAANVVAAVRRALA